MKVGLIIEVDVDADLDDEYDEGVIIVGDAEIRDNGNEGTDYFILMFLISLLLFKVLVFVKFFGVAGIEYIEIVALLNSWRTGWT